MNDVIDRYKRCYELYIKGKSYSQIGKEFGVDKEKARHMVTKYLREAKSQSSIGQTKLDTE